MLLRICKHVHHAVKPIRVKPPCATKSASLQTAARAQSAASAGTKWYAVRQGKRVGIFTSWAQVEPLVIGWAGSQYKSFKSLEDAKLFLGGRDTEKGLLPGISSSGRQSRGGQGPLPVKLHRVLSTDGASTPLPPAHVAVVLKPDACYPRLGPHITQGGKDFWLYFDGGSRGNPGVAGFGAVMKEADSKAVVRADEDIC
ncbi:RNase H [Haematococcus lacustris]|uniref:RNase H n=1 Tax=Haematococcus lacustris TaxID=44745 RepID=A0A699YAM2_HAELA|nr:RNase H [Haematococcus lacustris]